MKLLNNNIKRVALSMAIAAVAAAGVSAQNTESAFFTDTYLYRFQLNPAFGNEKNFVGMPALSNLNFGLNGTLHASSLLYNVGGKTTTFLNPGVSANDFLKNINDRNRIGIDLRETLLAAGFKALGGYNTVTVSARSNMGLYLPGDLFRLLKEGPANKTYNLANMGMQANAWAEIGLGHSRDIKAVEGLRVGGTVKFLLGVGNASTRIEKAELALGTDSWDITANAELNASIKGLEYETSRNDRTGRDYVSGAKFNNPGLSGFGLAVDLGAEYTLNKDWHFALSITDLGFISWSVNNVASTNGTRTFKSADYTFNVSEDSENSFDNVVDQMKDKLSYIYQLEDMGDKGSRTTGIGATLYAGVDYTFPLYRKLKFGLMNSTRIQGDFTWTNFRLSANVTPVKIFSAGVNYSYGTFGSSFGCILNLNVTGFSLFLATDHMPGKLAKQGVPLSSNAQFTLGMNFPF